jgi:hypothetical protein
LHGGTRGRWSGPQVASWALFAARRRPHLRRWQRDARVPGVPSARHIVLEGRRRGDALATYDASRRLSPRLRRGTSSAATTACSRPLGRVATPTNGLASRPTRSTAATTSPSAGRASSPSTSTLSPPPYRDCSRRRALTRLKIGGDALRAFPMRTVAHFRVHLQPGVRDASWRRCCSSIDTAASRSPQMSSVGAVIRPRSARPGTLRRRRRSRPRCSRSLVRHA